LNCASFACRCRFWLNFLDPCLSPCVDPTFVLSSLSFPGGNRVWPTQGYYVPDGHSGNVYQCQDPTGERCVGYDSDNNVNSNNMNDNSFCGVGYTGTLCSICSDGYFSDGSVCLSCGGEETASPFLISLLTFAFFFSLFLCVTFVRNRILDRIGLVIGACQQLLAAGTAVLVYFSPKVRIIYNYFRLIRLDFSFLRGDCHGQQFTLVNQFFISFVLLGVLYLFFILGALIYQYRTQAIPDEDESKSKGNTKQLMRDAYQNGQLNWKQIPWLSEPTEPRLMRAVIFLFYITYVQVAVQSLTQINCSYYPIYADLNPPSSTLRLYADQTVVCFQGDHVGAAIIAIVALVVLSIGLPIYFLYKLRIAYQRGILMSKEFRSNWSFLYQGMHAKDYWFRSTTFVLHLIAASNLALLKPQVYTQISISLGFYVSKVILLWGVTNNRKNHIHTQIHLRLVAFQ